MGLVIAGGALHVGTNHGQVAAVHADTGSLLWSYKTGNAIHSSPAVANGVVFVSSSDGYVYALYGFEAELQSESEVPARPSLSDLREGELLWRYRTGAGVWSSPAVENGVVSVGSNNGYVYALKATPGE